MDLPPVPYNYVSACRENGQLSDVSYVAASKVTTLEHELGNDTVEGRS